MTSGFAGTDSDGLVKLDRDRTLGAPSPTRSPATSSRPPGWTGPGSEFTLALGFGATQAEAVRTAGASLANRLDHVLARYAVGWAAYDAGLRQRAARGGDRRAAPGSACAPGPMSAP